MSNLQDFRKLNNALISKLHKVNNIIVQSIMPFMLDIKKENALIELTSNDADYLHNGYDFEDVQSNIEEQIESDIKEGFLNLNTNGTFNKYASSLGLHSLYFLDKDEILAKTNYFPEKADLEIELNLPPKETSMLISMYSSECTKLIHILRTIETETNYLSNQIQRLARDKEKEFKTGIWRTSIDLDILIQIIKELKQASSIEPLGSAPTHFSSSDKEIRLTSDLKTKLFNWSNGTEPVSITPNYQ